MLTTCTIGYGILGYKDMKILSNHDYTENFKINITYNTRETR